MHRHRSSAMHRGIAVVALPRLDEKSLSRARDISAPLKRASRSRAGAMTFPCFGRVITNNPG
jgi:hypothetical protein